MSTALVWFRNDLRTHDHAPLTEALREHERVVCVYCFDPRRFAATRWGFPKSGLRHTQFLAESVGALRRALRRLGGELVIRQGEPEDVLPGLARRVNADYVYAHEEVTSEETGAREAAEAALRAEGVSMHLSWGHTLYHPHDLPFRREDIPAIYTDFRKAVEKQSTVRDLLPTPTSLTALPDGLDAGELPSATDLVQADARTPLEPDPRTAIPFSGGEAEALSWLDRYLWERDLLKTYKVTRNEMLGPDFSSKFSPFLAHGCLSPRKIWHEVQRYESERTRNKSTYWMTFELLWRDFFRFAGWQAGDRLFRITGPADIEKDWRTDDDDFERWASGTTGFPLVDATMRELNATGYMSNRGRQNAASFLAHNLGHDWRRGAAYFEHKLVDYDVTSNWGNWAYVAGVGHDPRSRYFNITSQAERYDPRAAYVKTWLPELEALPPKLAREPYMMTPMEAGMYGVTLGEDYPEPMIDLEASYERLRAARRG